MPASRPTAHPNFRPIYWPISWSLHLALSSAYRIRVEGMERIPRKGGLLVASNHVSNLDPVLLTAIFPRPVTFMGKVELFRHWYARWAARWSQTAFPVRRGEMDIGAVRDALSYLQQGAALVLFPEGTRSSEGRDAPLPGVGYLAARGHCPVLPIGISWAAAAAGGRPIVRRVPVLVRMGSPFEVDSATPPAQLANEIMARVVDLLDAEHQGEEDACEGAAR